MVQLRAGLPPAYEALYGSLEAWMQGQSLEGAPCAARGRVGAHTSRS